MVDEALALLEVREFAARVQTADGMWDAYGSYLDNPAYKELLEVIHKQLPLIRDIASELDEDLAERIDLGINGGHGMHASLAATNELVGILESADRRAAIFEVKGPRLALSSMHPWVYGNADQQWADGHHRAAVATAASAIFDVYLPAKVQIPKGTDVEQMIGKAFGSVTNPFLKIPGVPASGHDRTNAYQGAQHLGLACAKLVRNLRTHNVTAPADEDELLEELAMLSRFARIVDSSTV